MTERRIKELVKVLLIQQGNAIQRGDNTRARELGERIAFLRGQLRLVRGRR